LRGDPSMLRLTPFLVAALLPALAAAQQLTAACRSDLAAVDASFEETLARLQKAGSADQAEKCAAVAHHIDVMGKARDVYLRCLPPGHDRDENVAQLNASIADFRDVQTNLKCR
jgi:hypothetical protein